uniref:Uncharacterized protein n=1 Tax=Anguilla anguilla TaxID=7936 RepID=A0A0E9XQT6_ANGAN
MGRGPCSELSTDITFNPGLLIGEGPNIDFRDDIINALGDVGWDRVRVFINVPISCNTEHLPVCGFKTVLEGFPHSSVELPEKTFFLF